MSSNYQSVGYIRVSSQDQNTARQLMGFKLDKTFEEKISGKDRKRPELEKMLSYIREGDHVYVHSMDRLARNLKDLLDLVNEITDKGCTVHFVTQNLVFSKDESNPTAKLMLQVMGAVAEFERSIILERQREGIAAAKARGNYKTGRPIVMTDEKKKLCHEKHAVGVPLTRIAKDLGVSRMSVYRELKKSNLIKGKKEM